MSNDKIVVVLNDEIIYHVWKCPDCKSTARVTADFYQENGTPLCSPCDGDMEYIQTEIEIPKNVEIPVILTVGAK